MQPARNGANLARAHAAPGDERQPACLLQPQQAPGLGAGHVRLEGGGYRDAQGLQAGTGQAPANEVPRQVRGGNDVGIAVGFLGEGDAYIVCGNEDAGRHGHAPPLHLGDDLRGKQMGAEHHVAGMRLQLLPEDARHAAVDMVYRRAEGQAAVGVAQGICRAEQVGGALGHGHIGDVDAPGQGVAVQGIGVQHPGAVAPALQLLLQGPGGGVMPSAGAAGHDQSVHSHFTLAFTRASRLTCSRMQITAAIMVKPIRIPGSTGSSHITAVVTR